MRDRVDGLGDAVEEARRDVVANPPPLGVALGALMAERARQLGGVGRRRLYLVGDSRRRGGARRGGGPGGPQLAWVGLGRGEEGALGRRGGFGLLRSARDDVEPERGVEHGAAEAAEDRESPPPFEVRGERARAARGLQSKEPA